jgi:hypothetical protein
MSSIPSGSRPDAAELLWAFEHPFEVTLDDVAAKIAAGEEGEETTEAVKQRGSRANPATSAARVVNAALNEIAKDNAVQLRQSDAAESAGERALAFLDRDDPAARSAFVAETAQARPDSSNTLSVAQLQRSFLRA